MAYQELTPEPGKYKIIATLKGQDIMGIKLKAPMAFYEVIYTLPMLTIKPDKGTGTFAATPTHRRAPRTGAPHTLAPPTHCGTLALKPPHLHYVSFICLCRLSCILHTRCPLYLWLG